MAVRSWRHRPLARPAPAASNSGVPWNERWSPSQMRRTANSIRYSSASTNGPWTLPMNWRPPIPTRLRRAHRPPGIRPQASKPKRSVQRTLIHFAEPAGEPWSASESFSACMGCVPPSSWLDNSTTYPYYRVRTVCGSTLLSDAGQRAHIFSWLILCSTAQLHHWPKRKSRDLATPLKTWTLQTIHPLSVINISLFDVLSCALSTLHETVISENRSEISSLIVSLLDTVDFEHAITVSTNSTRQVRTRFEMIDGQLSNFPRLEYVR